MNGQNGVTRHVKATRPSTGTRGGGLSVQELKAMTAMRMSQAQELNSPRIVVGTPSIAVIPAPTVLQAPVLAVNSHGRIVQARAVNGPVIVGARDMTEFAIPAVKSVNAGYVPIQKAHSSSVDNKAPAHALTVQELKELTRMRLAREAAESAYGGGGANNTGDITDKDHFTPSPQQQQLYASSSSIGRRNGTVNGHVSDLEGDVFSIPAHSQHSHNSHSGTTTPDSEQYMDDVELTAQGMTPVHEYQRAQLVAVHGRSVAVGANGLGRGASNVVNSQGFVKARVPMLNLYQNTGHQGLRSSNQEGMHGNGHTRISPSNVMEAFALDDHALAMRMAQQGRLDRSANMHNIRPHSHSGTAMHTPRLDYPTNPRVPQLPLNGLQQGSQYIDSRITSPMISPRDAPVTSDTISISSPLVSPRDMMSRDILSRDIVSRDILSRDIVSRDMLSRATPASLDPRERLPLSAREPMSIREPVNYREPLSARDGLMVGHRDRDVLDVRSVGSTMSTLSSRAPHSTDGYYHEPAPRLDNGNFSADELLYRLQAQAQGVSVATDSSQHRPGHRSTGSMTPNGLYGMSLAPYAASPGNRSVGSVTPSPHVYGFDGLVSPPNGLVQGNVARGLNATSSLQFPDTGNGGGGINANAVAQLLGKLEDSNYSSLAGSNGVSVPSLDSDLLGRQMGHLPSDPVSSMLSMSIPAAPSASSSQQQQLIGGSIAAASNPLEAIPPPPPALGAGNAKGVASRIIGLHGGNSPSGSPKTFRHKQPLHLACPPSVRDRSISDVNDIVFEMAESVLDAASPAISRTATPKLPGQALSQAHGLRPSRHSESSLSSDPLVRALQSMASNDSIGSLASNGSHGVGSQSSLLFSGSTHGSAAQLSSQHHPVTGSSNGIAMSGKAVPLSGEGDAANGYSIGFEHDDASIATSVPSTPAISHVQTLQLAAPVADEQYSDADVAVLLKAKLSV